MSSNAELINDVAGADAQPPSPKPAERFRILTTADLETAGPPNWLVDGLFEQGAPVLLYGSPSAGKSFLALDWALHISSGTPWLGRKVKTGPVLYIYAEGSRAMRRRIEAWKKANPGADIADFARFVTDQPQLLNTGEVEQLIQKIEKQNLKFQLIVVDTLARCFVGGEENSAKDVGAAVASLDKIRNRTGAAVLVVHHSGKNSASERGSTALWGAVDTKLRLDRIGNSENRLLLCEKQKEDEEFHNIALVLDQVNLGADGNGVPMNSCVFKTIDAEATGTSQFSDKYKKLLAIFHDKPGVQFTTAALKSAWTSVTNQSDQSFNTERKRALDLGHIKQVKKGVYELPDSGSATAKDLQPK
jgi:hypothetical protein